MTYKEYLQTKEWKEFAKAERKRAGYRCKRCKAKGVELHVHHKTYRRKYDGSLKLPKPGETDVICDICHRAEHGLIRI